MVVFVLSVNILGTSLYHLHPTLFLIVEVKKLKMTLTRIPCRWVVKTVQVLLIRSRLEY